ncbi:MAG: M4 family metallopeptidase [Acidobacteria bacterium]|nr:M4 family metallopeptidase [Acidobacteriota bacterium]
MFAVMLAIPTLAQQTARTAMGGPEDRARAFSGTGHTFHGDWRADVFVSRLDWSPGQSVAIDVSLQFSGSHLSSLASAGIKADRLCVLVTAERTFDADGWMRLPGDEKMSTLLTPAGLAIEGGAQGAVTTRYGYPFKSPLDELVSIPIAAATTDAATGDRIAAFPVRVTLPSDLPPGLYRLRFDFGVMVGKSVYNFNGFTFAARTFSTEAGTITYFYSPLVIPAAGVHASGRVVDALRIQPRFPWLLLANYNSNGYQGVVADEDRARFALSNRNLIPDDVILPMYNDSGSQLSYSLEPQFPADTIDPYQNLPWNWSSGEYTVRIAGPDGSLVTLGPAKFAAKSGNGPTTKNTSFTSWKPQRYGRYTVTATGWIEDETGRRYEGGGTYRFWIAKRMTLATATFQGMPYPIGSTYGRDIQFNPAVPADVQVTASLFVNSDPALVRTLSYAGKASPQGMFGAAQGMKSFPLDAPGEYHAQVTATYTDAEGHLWVSVMRHAGVVYADISAVVARGKKFAVANKYVERGETKFEGSIDPDGTQHLAHITFPYYAGDMLLIGAEGQGANKIEPVLTYQMQGDTSAWDTNLNGVGTTNLRIKTSNGYSPHLYPEYITDREYYYGAAPRPGFMGRFIVGESIVRAPYWPVSPNAFGGQIGASPNGDAPGDIYRLLGGVVLRRSGQAPMYSGYIASAFLLPRGTNNNRVVAAGSEDLNGPLGERARFFLVGLRPGTSYEIGSTFRPALQIDPLLPVSIQFTLIYPDGRQQVATGVGDRFGSFAGPTAWMLDQAGVYRYQIRATWNGFQGRMPGLPESGGEFFVYSKTRPAGVTGLRIDGASQRTFSAAGTTTISGATSASVVHYTLITPGAVIEQGDLAVNRGAFQYVFDPVAVHAKVPLYDITSITTGKPQIGRVIHLTFFAEEKNAAGASFFDVTRVVLRGTTVIAARPVVASTLAMAGLPTASAGTDAAVAEAIASVPDSAVRVIATDAAAIRDWDGRLDRMVRDGALMLVRRESDSLLPDRAHERLQQAYKGVPVFGSEVTRQTRHGVTVSIIGSLHAGIDVDASPTVSAEEAQRLVERRTGGRVTIGRGLALVVLPLDDGGYALAWQAEVRSGIDVRSCFVDASTGQVLADYSMLKTAQPAPGQHVRVLNVEGTAARTAEAVRDGVSTAMASPGAATDAVALAAQAHAYATVDFLAQRFNRRGVDGEGHPAVALVHPARIADWPVLRDQFARYYAGAFWDGHMAVLGEGLPPGETADGHSWSAAAVALDIVAHELAHGVSDASAGFTYRGESGALSEAFSDIMETAVEFAAQPAGPGFGQADYLIGEDATPGGLRSLEQPAQHGHPDHVSARDLGAADNGAVHANSTIVSHAYFLAVEGGTNRTSGLSVEGVGRQNRSLVEKAVYRAFVYMLPSNATFAMARAATVQSARDLYGDSSAVERALVQAWTAVGIE